MTSPPLLPDVDFSRIRPHRGTASGGFEELAVQLFRAEYGSLGEVRRMEGSGGDTGIEAFVFASANREIGIQAKFFDRLGAPQWNQIKGSIVRATAEHPKLKTYIVAVPLDRNPTQQKTWTTLVKAWRKRVKLVWWGSSEIKDFLTRAAHRGRLLYWFGSREDFNFELFRRQNAVARAALDDRYTPTRHVKTDGQLLLEAFTSCPSFLQDYLPLAERMVQAWRQLGSFGKAKGEKRKDKKLAAAKKELDIAWRALRDAIGEGKMVPPLKNLNRACSNFGSRIDEVRRRLMQLEGKWQEERKSTDTSPHSWRLRELRELSQAFRELADFARKFSPADARFLLIEGEGGIGKSHLLAAVVEELEAKSQWALLTLGEFFRSSDDPWQQLLSHIGWEGSSTDFLQLLNHAAEMSDRPALICIDALNESGDRQLWRTQLLSFAARLNEHPNVKLTVSCRSDFTQITIPEAVRQNRARGWAHITHRGFADHLFQAVLRFFAGYHVTTDYFPPLLTEFRNPLFLKTVCEAYEGQRLPAGALTLRSVMERRIARLQEKLLQDIDCPKDTTRQAVELIANEMSHADASTLPLREIRTKVDALLPGRGESQSLYRHLVSNRLLTEIGAPEEGNVLVRFQYERFADFFIAQAMLLKFKTADELRTQWRESGFLTRLLDWRYAVQHPGLIRALGILLPERFSIELPDLASVNKPNENLLSRWLSGLPWRSAASMSDRTLELLKLAEKQFGSEVIFDSLLSTSTIPKHPFNAKYFHRVLMQCSLVRRDEVWTTYLNDRTAWPEEESTVLELIRWSEAVPRELVSDEQSFLVAVLLCWFCTSTRHEFRDRATVAAIRLLDQRPLVAERLIRSFKNCNDPYVITRVFAVASGVAMRLARFAGLPKLAATVHETVFAQPEVPASLTLRDYAACVLELAAAKSQLPPAIDPTTFRPPFRSRLPRICTEKRATIIEDSPGWERIKSSIQPESRGWYGDFGRYEMGFRVRHFQSTPHNRKPQTGRQVQTFDEMAARRYVLQRVWQLGWRPELFGDYEASLSYYDRSRAKVERISKKYQWIALDELLAYLSDHYHLTPDWSDAPQQFRGAWQLFGRDFDPSQPFRAISEAEQDYETQQPWWSNYPDTLAVVTSKRGRKDWVEATAIPDFASLLTPPSLPEDRHHWLNLCGYHWWNEKLPFGEERSGRGVLKMWIHVRSWFVAENDCNPVLRRLQAVNFYGNGIQVPEFHEAWLGEYPWGASLQDFGTHYPEYDRWPATDVLPLTPTVCSYGGENATRTGLVPSPRTLGVIDGHWGGSQFDYLDANGELIAYSPEPFAGHNWTTCLIRKDMLLPALKRHRLRLIWAVLAERSCWDRAQHVTESEGQISGVYSFDGKKIAGGISNIYILRIPTSTRGAL